MGLGMKLGVRRAHKRTLYRRPPEEPARAKTAPTRGMVGVVGDDVTTRRKRMNI